MAKCFPKETCKYPRELYSLEKEFKMAHLVRVTRTQVSNITYPGSDYEVCCKNVMFCSIVVRSVYFLRCNNGEKHICNELTEIR